MQWILGLALAALVFIILKRWGALDAGQKKAATWKMVMIVGGALLAFMILTGRVHVLTAAVAALIPLVRRLPDLLRFAPQLSKLFGQKASEQSQEGEANRQTSASGQMSVAEACDILNVEPGCSRDEVIAAHRRLMQKIHPDRGGNDYLAAKVNEAKAVLLGKG